MDAPNQTYRPPRNVVVMGLVSFFNDIASEMIYPIVPLFLNTVLGAPAAVIGLIEGIAESTASLLKIVSGWFSDKIRRRKIFVTFGYSLSTFSKLLIGLAGSWPFVLFARFVDRFGKGTRVAARDALILESVSPEHKGRAFGLHRAMDSAGAVVGPMLALLMIYVFAENYRQIFFWAFVPGFIGVLLLIIFVKEKHRPAPAIQASPSKPRWRYRDLDPGLKLFLLTAVIFGVGNSSDAFLILRAQNLGLVATLTVAAYVLFNLTYSAFSYPAGVLSDRFGPRRVLLAGFVLFGAVYLALGLTQSPWAVWILFPLYGVYMALTDGVSRAYIAQTVPVEKSGTAFGAYQTVVGVCALLSSLIAGWLWGAVSPAAPFVWGGALAFLAALIFGLGGLKRPTV